MGKDRRREVGFPDGQRRWSRSRRGENGGPGGADEILAALFDGAALTETNTRSIADAAVLYRSAENTDSGGLGGFGVVLTDVDGDGGQPGRCANRRHPSGWNRSPQAGLAHPASPVVRLTEEAGYQPAADRSRTTTGRKVSRSGRER